MNNNFIKADGCGNTFIIVENFIDTYLVSESLKSHNIDSALVVNLINKENNDYVFKMDVVEKDGSVSEFCGNGARALAAYFCDKYGEENRYYLQTSNFQIPIGKCSTGFYVSLPYPEIYSFDNKFCSIQEGQFMYENILFYKAQTIEPHLVTFAEIDKKELVRVGEKINSDRETFPFGMNINVVKIENKNLMTNITYERGVNDLTKSCGSGSTSAVAIATDLGFIELPCCVETPGGNLYFEINEQFLIMSGNAQVDWKNYKSSH